MPRTSRHNLGSTFRIFIRLRIKIFLHLWYFFCKWILICLISFLFLFQVFCACICPCIWSRSFSQLFLYIFSRSYICWIFLSLLFCSFFLPFYFSISLSTHAYSRVIPILHTPTNSLCTYIYLLHTFYFYLFCCLIKVLGQKGRLRRW